jgi:glucose-1-phosphate thymidylyltransferase
MTQRKGIILAGGSGTRLWPVTLAVSKQLLPVYDKPMIYYPLSVLMLAGIREIAIITTPQDKDQFRRLLCDGTQWGIRLTYIVQPNPEGLAQAYLLARDFLDGAPSALILGDNIFFGHGLPELLRKADHQTQGATVFGYQVSDPERYGVVEFGPSGEPVTIIEKPSTPPSNYAVTGLYFFDENASDFAQAITPSPRGELEIVDLLGHYLRRGNLRVERLGRGFAWFDIGTHTSLLEAANFVRTLTDRQGLQFGSPDEVAWQLRFVSDAQLQEQARRFLKSGYGQYLSKRLEMNSP